MSSRTRSSSSPLPTYEEVRKHRNKVRERFYREHDAVRRNKLLIEYKSLCNLTAFLYAFEHARRDAQLDPARFEGKTKSQAIRLVQSDIKDLEALLPELEEEKAHSANDPGLPALEIAMQLTKKEIAIREKFRGSLRGRWLYSIQSQIDTSSFQQNLNNFRDDVLGKVSECCRILSSSGTPLPHLSPVSTNDPGRSTGPFSQQPHQLSLGKVEFSPVSRRARAVV